jgi:2-hydroxychromene-2-carboxylate isomerase
MLATFYFDLASPYSYLAAERVDGLFAGVPTVAVGEQLFWGDDRLAAAVAAAAR